MLLRNGQSLEISEATPLKSEVQFVVGARLACPQTAWLQRTSDGSMIEISLTSASPEAEGWRYQAELASPVERTAPPRAGAWGLLRRLKKS
ncbi:MAG TPA: hypothetical protein VGN57_05285 [Pirellulaceae bacterium]|nr:hypothetical protein [Pirellulaceae bacterium]